MQQWEYALIQNGKVIYAGERSEAGSSSVPQQAAQLGLDGWEMFAIDSRRDSDYTTYWFKRPLA